MFASPLLLNVTTAFPDATPGDVVLANNAAIVTSNPFDGTWTKWQEITVHYNGSFRVKHDNTLEAPGWFWSNPADVHSVSSRIYKNGVAYGTTRTLSANQFGSHLASYSEDLAFSNGDTIELWGSGPGWFGVGAGNLALCAAVFQPGGATVTL